MQQSKDFATAYDGDIAMGASSRSGCLVPFLLPVIAPWKAAEDSPSSLDLYHLNKLASSHFGLTNIGPHGSLKE